MMGDKFSSYYHRAAAGLGAAVLLIIASFLISGCAPSGGQAGGGTMPPVAAPAKVADPASQTTRIPVEGGGSYLDVGAAGLAAMLKNKDFPLINVHIPYEGEIEPTDAFIPYTEMESNLGKLPSDKGARIVLYCRSGSMSATAARVLVKQGYTNLFNLDGGFIGWQQAGYPVAHKTR